MMIFRHSGRALWFSLPLLLLIGAGHAQTPVGDLYAADATVKGAVALSAASTRVMSGSSVQAGMSNATVRLVRGGELRVCQGSSVSLTSSANGTQIMVGMNSGTIEVHYPLANSRDSIMTPDFEIALNGPGLFHLAVSTDQSGNTCVQSLHGNSGSITVSELMGDGSYTVTPGEQVIFRAGRAGNPGQGVANCGCPALIPVQRAEAEAPVPTVPAAAPVAPVAALINSSPKDANVTAPPPPEQPGSIHVQVEAPFVFRASAPPAIPEAPAELAQIRLSSLPVFDSAYIPPAPQAQVAQTAGQETLQPRKKKRHGLWGFLASIFKG